MSIKVMNYVWENSKRSGTKLVALLALADFSDDYGDSFPGIRRLSKKTRTGERNLQKILREFHDNLEITIHDMMGVETGHGKTNKYTVHTNWNPCTRKLVGVNHSSPDVPEDTPGVSPSSPLGVNPSSPNPSGEPPVNPSLPPTPLKGGKSGGIAAARILVGTTPALHTAE